MRNVSLLQICLVIAALSILVSITGPSLERRVELTRTAEPVSRLAEIARRSASYWSVESGGADVATRSFPPSASATPPEPPHATRVAPSAEAFAQPGWRALGFAPTEPSYFSYRYDSVGTGLDARFVARAEGDLDGDGERSTFERHGRIAPDGTVDLSSGLWFDRPLE